MIHSVEAEVTISGREDDGAIRLAIEGPIGNQRIALRCEENLPVSFSDMDDLIETLQTAWTFVKAAWQRNDDPDNSTGSGI